MDREDLRFAAGAATCAAWLYRPPQSGADPRPIVVMAHGLSGTRRDRLGAFAERFAAAGFFALVFDHRGFGESGGEPDLFHPGLQLEDWRAAIEFARALPGVDPERVATFGSSMGGGNALAAAAKQPRGERRWESCGPTRASTTSTSTTAPSTRRSSLTNSTSSGATCSRMPRGTHRWRIEPWPNRFLGDRFDKPD